MIEIGKINTLTVTRRVGSDIYLAHPASSNILLVDKKPPAHCKVGDSIDVFVYVDMDDHLAATTIRPKAFVDDIAWLRAVSVNRIGAFMDWGMPKDLLIPAAEHYEKLEVGRSYLVKLYLDANNRILGSTRIERFLSENGIYFTAGQKVSLLIAGKTDLGIKAIVNNTHWGLLYGNETTHALEQGQRIDGYIQRIRDDYKIDLSLYRSASPKDDQLADRIVARLKENKGVLSLSDKSPANDIYAAFGVSKRAYKQTLGALYKQKRIIIGDDTIRLVDHNPNKSRSDE